MPAVKKVASILALTIFAIWGKSHTLQSRVLPDSVREKQFLAGIELSVREQFGESDSLFKALVKSDPGDPWGHFFWAVGIAARMMDAEQDSFSPAFSIQLSIAQQLTEKELKKLKKGKKEKERPDLFLLMGNIWGYKALDGYRKGHWYGGLSAGLKAKGNFEKALQFDSTFYDAYNGLGNYYFWKSARTRKFPISAFISDERQKGIEQLVVAKEKGFFSRQAAAGSLLWALIGQKEFKWAQALADSLAVQYPQAKSFLWAKGSIYQEQKRWDSSVVVYSKLLSQLEADPFQSGFNMVECRWRLANAYYNSHRYQEALLECKSAKNYSLSDKSKKRLKTRLKKLAEISKKSKKALAQVEPR